MLNKEECELALEEFAYRSERPLLYEYRIVRKLINDFFDNPPLKFEEIEEDMWVWDNQKKCYVKVRGTIKTTSFNCKTEEVTVKKEVCFRWGDSLYEENRFYRREVKEND